MQPQPNFSETSTGQQDAVVCQQCGAPMPKEMRFCRSCGNRLGEGPAEYTETVRFQSTTARPSTATTPFYPGVQAQLVGSQTRSCRRRVGFTGMTWMWIALGVFFVAGGGMSALRKSHISRPVISVPRNRSFFGVESFDSTNGGLTFKVVDPPGGPADKAGLVGGDIVTSFDGHLITDDDQIMDLLAKLPIGKTVEVQYLRDGVAHKTQLTTVSREEYSRLEQVFNGRPEGKGLFGFESSRMTRINNPETKTFGVRIDYVEPNGPADLSGIKKGDIITSFDNVPIRTADEFLSRVRQATPYTTVDVALIRDNQPIVIPVKMGKAR